jgi:hypothetical protein
VRRSTRGRRPLLPIGVVQARAPVPRPSERLSRRVLGVHNLPAIAVGTVAGVLALRLSLPTGLAVAAVVSSALGGMLAAPVTALLVGLLGNSFGQMVLAEGVHELAQTPSYWQPVVLAAVVGALLRYLALAWRRDSLVSAGVRSRPPSLVAARPPTHERRDPDRGPASPRGWYLDPGGSPGLARYWNGERWTSETCST